MTSKDQEYTLAPCPFCGKEGEYEVETLCIGHGDYIKDHKVRCKKCKSTGPHFDNWDYPEEELKMLAISSWNHRERNTT